jgi:hypothetical protein
VPLELLNWPRHVKDWIRRNEPPKPESTFESTTSKIAPSDPSRILKGTQSGRMAMAPASPSPKSEAGQGARRTDKNEPPKPESHPESATSRIVPGDPSRIQNRDPKAQAREIAGSIIAKARKRIPDHSPIQQALLPHECCPETAE